MAELHNCSDTVAATAGFLTALVLSSQSGAFHCKKIWKNWLFGILSTTTFCGVNYFRTESMKDVSHGLNVSMIMLPTLMHCLNELAVCKKEGKSAGRKMIQSVDIMVCLLLPVAVYEIARSEKLRMGVCKLYDTKKSGLKSMMPGNSQPTRLYSDSTMEKAKMEAHRALQNAIRVIDGKMN
jgi:hypothetical protein